MYKRLNNYNDKGDNTNTSFLYLNLRETSRAPQNLLHHIQRDSSRPWSAHQGKDLLSSNSFPKGRFMTTSLLSIALVSISSPRLKPSPKSSVANSSVNRASLSSTNSSSSTPSKLSSTPYSCLTINTPRGC